MKNVYRVQYDAVLKGNVISGEVAAARKLVVADDFSGAYGMALQCRQRLEEQEQQTSAVNKRGFVIRDIKLVHTSVEVQA